MNDVVKLISIKSRAYARTLSFDWLIQIQRLLTYFTNKGVYVVIL